MTVTLLDARVETGGEPREETGRRQTFSDAFEHVLATSQLKAIADGQRPVEEWRDAWRCDTDAVHGIVDQLAEDLTRVTGREVVRTSCLEFDPPFTSPRCAGEIKEISDAFCHAAQWYVRRRLLHITMGTLVDVPRMGTCAWRRPAEAYVTWPCTCQGVLTVELENAYLTDAYDFVRATPRRVQRQLAALQETHLDYRPAVLVGDIQRERIVGDPALVLRLDTGCPDIVAWYWRETLWQRVKLFVRLSLPLTGLVVFLLFMGALGVAAMCGSSIFESFAPVFFSAGLLLTVMSSFFGGMTLAAQFLRRSPLCL